MRGRKMNLTRYACFGVLMVLILTGCQATPNQDVIANKNDQQVSQSESGTSIEESNSVEESDDDGTVVSEAISETFSSDDGNVTISVQTDAVKVHSVPIVQTEAKDISVDDVKRWAKAFYGTEDVYEATKQMTKSEIEEAILWRQQKINDRESLIEEGYSEADADTMIEYYKEQIESLKASYQKAPDDDERKKTDWAFHPLSYYDDDSMENDRDTSNADKTQALKVQGESDGQKAYVSASNRETADYQLHSLMFYWNDEDEGWIDGATPYVNQEEAIQITDEKLKALVDGNWKVNTVWSSSNQWHIQYIPVINELPCLYSDINYTSDDAYAANLEYGQINFTLTDDKIVAVEWESPMEITSTDSQPAEMLPFDDIYTAFKNYMQVKCTLNSLGLASEDETEGTEQAFANVNDISQMYCRVKVKNADNVFQYVPVYVFSGYVSQGDYKEDDWVNHFCVVNATDGTIINTWLGY